jgi:hypothetical protein
MIMVPNIDSKIWQPESMILDVIKEMSQGNPVKISLNNEGPCAESLGLYRILDDICARFNYPQEKITIQTCNQVEHHPEYRIEIAPPLYIDATQKFLPTVQAYTIKSFDQDFQHFGIFIGRSNWIRLWLASVLREKYNTAMTYHWRPRDEFHDAHIGIDDMLRWNARPAELARVTEFLAQCPLHQAEQNSYPILSPEHLNICKIYHKFFLEVICETYYSGTSFYPTEKTWRPLMMKTPFVVHGPVDYLTNLKKLGFKTFDKWWSEEYDIYGHDKRVRKILDLIDKIQKLSLNDLQSMYHDMTPVLDHNWQVFMEMDSKKFKSTFSYV